MAFFQFHLYKDTLKDLIRLSLPMMISQGAFAIMIFTDRYFMSQIGPLQMASSLGGGIASFFSFSLFTGVLSYATALVAQYYGAGDTHKCPRVLTQGLIMTVMCIPLLLIITLSVRQIFSLMGHAPGQVELEKIYYSMLMLGSIFNLSKTCFSSYFSGIGRTKIVMITDVLGAVLNVPLSYVLIFGKLGLPALGIVGAAAGTIISSFFALFLYILFYFHKEHRNRYQVMGSFGFDRSIMKRYVKFGLPSGIELFLNVAAFNLFILMFQSFGVSQGAAIAIVLNWDILSYVPMMGLNIGVISLTGRYIGGNRLGKINEVIYSGFLLGLSYSTVLGLIFISCRIPLVEIFNTPGADFADTRTLATFMMIGMSTYVMADAIILISSGILKGAGDTRWLMTASVTLHWLMLIAQYFIISVFDYGPKVSWMAFVALIFSIAIVYVTRLKGGKWRSQDKINMVMAEEN